MCPRDIDGRADGLKTVWAVVDDATDTGAGRTPISNNGMVE